MKKRLSLCLMLCVILALPLAACGSKPSVRATSVPGAASPAEVVVFAAASLTESLDAVIALYKEVAPRVTVVPTYDSSGTLLSQIENGADCDLFLSAAQKQMDALAEGGGLAEGSRMDLLENKVVLVVPDKNEKDIQSFDDLAQLLKDGAVLLAMGNADVPVGQYTQKIFTCYGLVEADLAAAGVLTYGSNVKEVTTQVGEGSVDCGIIYATDAMSAGLRVVAECGAEQCGRVVYPAAVLKTAAQAKEAAAFLEFLQTEKAAAAFAAVGFAPLS